MIETKVVYNGKREGEWYLTLDDEDVDLIECGWTLLFTKTNIYLKKNNVLIHRVILSRILGRELLPEDYVDHKNRDGLDNRRSNIRLSTQSQNMANQRNRKRLTRYKGVKKQKTGYWHARITVNWKEIGLGDYSTEVEAGIAYNHNALFYFGEFASFNDIPGWRETHPTRRLERREPSRINTTGYSSINYNKKMGKYHARITAPNKKRIHIGYFDDKHEAARVWNVRSRELYGANAYQNTIDE